MRLTFLSRNLLPSFLLTFSVFQDQHTVRFQKFSSCSIVCISQEQLKIRSS